MKKLRRKDARGHTEPVRVGTGLRIQVVGLQSPHCRPLCCSPAQRVTGLGIPQGFSGSGTPIRDGEASWDWSDTHKRKDPSVVPPGPFFSPLHLPTDRSTLFALFQTWPQNRAQLTVSSSHSRTRVGLESLTPCSLVPAVCRALSSGLKNSTLQNQEMRSLLLRQEEGTG